jgi:hypothetical protein
MTIAAVITIDEMPARKNPLAALHSTSSRSGRPDDCAVRRGRSRVILRGAEVLNRLLAKVCLVGDYRYFTSGRLRMSLIEIPTSGTPPNADPVSSLANRSPTLGYASSGSGVYFTSCDRAGTLAR